MHPQAYDVESHYPWYKTLGFIALSTSFSELLASPLERVKIKLQTKSFETAPGPLHLRHIGSLIGEIMSKEGASGLFYGFRSILDRAVTFQIARFYGYYMSMKHVCKNPTYEFKYEDVIVSTLLGTTLATVCAQPSEILRLKLQGEVIGDQASKKVSFGTKVSQLSIAYGSKNAFVAGMGWNIFLQNSQALIETLGFFTVRDFLMRRHSNQSQRKINCISALVASTLTSLVTAPLDFFNTRFVFRQLGLKQTSKPTYIMFTLQLEGLSGIYKSFLPHLYRSLVFNMSMVMMLEYLTGSNQVESLLGERRTTATINTQQQNLGSGIESPTNIGNDATNESKII